MLQAHASVCEKFAVRSSPPDCRLFGRQQRFRCSGYRQFQLDRRHIGARHHFRGPGDQRLGRAGNERLRPAGN
jgi:hypothetical protein